MTVLSAVSSRRNWTLSLRTWLWALALICTAGALFVGSLAGWYSWQQQKYRVGQNLVATTRAIIQLAERELDRAASVALALSSLHNLQEGDLRGFEQRARVLAQTFGYFLIVSTPGSPREVINTDVPPGVALPELPPEWRTGASEQPTVKPLVLRATDRHWTAAVQMLSKPKVGPAYVITVGVPSARFQKIIEEQQLPSDWSPVILDQEWTVVARGISPEKFIGHKGASPQIQNLPSADSTYEGRVLEGFPTINARSRSEKFAWTSAIAIPQSAVSAQLMGPAFLAAGAGFLVSLLGVAVLGFFAARLAQDVQALSTATEQLSKGTISSVVDMHIKELESVAKAMQDAGKRIRAEEQFRKRTVEELAHRLRNKIATVQAILLFQLREQPRLRDAIWARLSALQATDELIIAAQGRGADILDIVETELRPYEASRLTADGPPVFLEPKLALSLALTLHELATNAAKYGALSAPKGSVSIKWSVGNARLDLEWRENDGPPVTKPTRHGFGTRLVNGVLAAFGGKAEANFEPTGLVVRMTMILREAAQPIIHEGERAQSLLRYNKSRPFSVR
jgi:two-component sensor histidine kinase